MTLKMGGGNFGLVISFIRLAWEKERGESIGQTKKENELIRNQLAKCRTCIKSLAQVQMDLKPPRPLISRKDAALKGTRRNALLCLILLFQLRLRSWPEKSLIFSEAVFCLAANPDLLSSVSHSPVYLIILRTPR